MTMKGAPLLDGGVVVKQGRIAAVGPFHEIQSEWAGSRLIDLGERTLMPGLINAHCHLDYTGLRGAIPPQTSFTRWIGRINALKRELTEGDYLKAIADGFAELKQWGTTTVCNLAAFPELLLKLPPPPIRTWWFPELLDIRDPAAAPDLLAAAQASMAAWREKPESRDALLRFGLSPHAPYTATPQLYRLCAAAARDAAMPLTTHIAESADEEAMFRQGRGELHALLAGLGRTMIDCGHASSFFRAVNQGLVGPGWLLTHANELGEADFAYIARTNQPAGAASGQWHFIHCPRSHAYFGHRPFPWQQLRELGATISLGTDSLASNDSLSLFAELQAAQKSVPGLTSETLLETVTVQPARALGKSGELGVIAPGARADLIALPIKAPLNEIYDALVANTCPIEWMMLDGKLC